MTLKNNTYSFADLVRNFKIEVPIIQRDYAQGRDTPKASTIRKEFVADLLTALKNPQKQPLELAFVYGRVENGVFIPVDGQQRLTTLYLLHLYLVKRCQALSTDLGQTCITCKYEDVLSQFTYATRQSSREFCETISAPETKIIPANETIKDYVHNQPWFFVEWQNDPTVEGMLEVLEEFHAQSKDFTREECAGYLDALFGAKSPIRFRFMDMEDYGQTDDLYLKMNARGLPLSPLENLKCSIEQFFEKNDAEEETDEETILLEWPQNDARDDIGESSGGTSKPDNWATLSVEKQFSHLLDRVWLDAFWNLQSNPGKCSEVMLVVLARLFALFALEKDGLQKNIGDKLNWGEKNLKTDKEAAEERKSAVNNYIHSVEDGLLSITGNEDFVPFDWFKDVLTFKFGGTKNRPRNVIKYISEKLNLFSRYKNNIADVLIPAWESENRNGQIEELVNDADAKWVAFLQMFQQDKAWKQYAAFFAILSFFSYQEQFDAPEFKDWMRVQWNIIENGPIDSFEAMGRYVRFCSQLATQIKELKEKDGILAFLASLNEQSDKSLFKEQFKEECLKARIIKPLRGTGSRDPEAEQRIISAENLPWFKGRIEAIFQDGQINSELESSFLMAQVGQSGSKERAAWVRTIIDYIEDQYEQSSSKPSVYIPVAGIINRDDDLKSTIYDKKNPWIIKTYRNKSENTTHERSWLARMSSSDRPDDWQNRVKIQSYWGGVYAYRGSYIPGAYRLDSAITWWHVFVDKCKAETNWQTKESGVWIECKIGDDSFALSQKQEESFVQIKPSGKTEWKPSIEEAKKIFMETILSKPTPDWNQLLEQLRGI